ncbi:MAG: hypothetical protein CMD79_01900 [Gammaproteobacteria bacterium]|nr:hypothetical protein [Gammaproteobacteria bacterium]
MSPEIQNNSYVVTTKLKTYNTNDIVAIKDNKIGMVIKRIKEIDDNYLTVESINKQYSSITSEMKFQYDDILGKVILKLFN